MSTPGQPGNPVCLLQGQCNLPVFIDDYRKEFALGVLERDLVLDARILRIAHIQHL
ncbi:MAG: hypothetical protein WBO37_10240 [Gammaproteobacteria bacterium]